MRDPPRRNFDVRLHLDTYVGQVDQRSPAEAFSYAVSYFSLVQLHPILKSFRLAAKEDPSLLHRMHHGRKGLLVWEGASPLETRRCWRVGVIGDLMSKSAAWRQRISSRAYPPPKPGLAASSCLRVCALICHACFFWSLAKRLILCSAVTWARFVVSQAVARKRQLDGAARWPSDLACVSMDVLMIKAARDCWSQSTEREQDVGTGVTASGCDRGGTIIELRHSTPSSDSPIQLSVFSSLFFTSCGLFFNLWCVPSPKWRRRC